MGYSFNLVAHPTSVGMMLEAPYEGLKNITAAIQSVITACALVIGGFWAAWRFIFRREGRARVEFDLGINVLGVQGDRLLIEVFATLQNKGLARHRIRDFTFDLLYLLGSAQVVDGGEAFNYQPPFEKAFVKRNWVPVNWGNSFADAGVTQTYTYLAHIPATANYVLVLSRFRYLHPSWDFHKAQRAFRIVVPKSI